MLTHLRRSMGMCQWIKKNCAKGCLQYELKHVLLSRTGVFVPSWTLYCMLVCLFYKVVINLFTYLMKVYSTYFTSPLTERMKYKEQKTAMKNCVICHTFPASMKVNKINLLLYLTWLIIMLKNLPSTPKALENNFNIIYVYYILVS
jgi:hypothetical protein